MKYITQPRDQSSLSLQVNTAPKTRIQRDLELLQLIVQLAHLLLQLRDVRVDLLRRGREHGLGVGERELEEGVSDFVSDFISTDPERN